MTEAEGYSALFAFLTKLAADAILIDPARPALGPVIFDRQESPRPVGPYAMIEFVTDRDLGAIGADNQVIAGRTEQLEAHWRHQPTGVGVLMADRKQ